MKSQATAPPWLRYLPSPVRSRIEHHPNLLKALSNTGWLFADKILRMGIGLLVGVWVARYLGPEQFGTLNYAMAFVALFGSIATLGLDAIVVRDLIKEPKSTNATLGTAFFLRVIGGLLALAFAIIAIGFARPDDTMAKTMVAVLGFVMVFRSTELVKYWFDSQVQSKYPVWVENGTFLLIAAVKIVLILNKAPLMAFVWAAFTEGTLVSLGLMVMYWWRGGRLQAWRVHYQRIKTLLNDSWPLILAGLAVMVYMRIDQIMLGQMLGDESVGIYSAAIRLSEVWYFIPTAIVVSVFPTIIEAKNQSEPLYYKRLQMLYDGMVVISLTVAIPVAYFADWIILVVYEQAYAQAGIVLSIHIWTGVFVFLGVASSKWFVIENMQMLAFYRTGLGMVINIVANYLLIPKYGISGAAVATLLAQVFAAYLFDSTNKHTRRSFVLKTTAMLLFIPGMRRMFKHV